MYQTFFDQNKYMCINKKNINLIDSVNIGWWTAFDDSERFTDSNHASRSSQSSAAEVHKHETAFQR